MIPVTPIPTPLSTFLLSHRPDLDIIFLRWLRPDTLAEAQLSYRDSLALALEHNGSNWLPLATLEAAIARADQVRVWGSLQAAIATQ